MIRKIANRSKGFDATAILSQIEQLCNFMLSHFV